MSCAVPGGAHEHNERVSWFRFRRRSRPQPESATVVRWPHDDPSLTDDQLITQRTQWFEAYTSQKNVVASESGGPYSCPCCGHVTLSERGAYEICRECGWEDDGQDDHDAQVVRGGPNGRQSLQDARVSYVQRGGNPLSHHPPSKPA